MRLYAALIAAALAGCAAGPEYHRPAPPAVASYTSEALPVETADAPVIGGAAPKAGQRDGLEWRSAVMAEDVGRVRSLVASTGFFNAAEAEVAADLVTERLTKGIRSGYHFVLAERGPVLVAYACYGPIEGTQGSFDLYWTAVAPEEQGRGLGAQVYTRAEAAMRKAGAKHIYADTSSSDRYAGTRGFYQRMGFHEEARLPDFYAQGDGKIKPQEDPRTLAEVVSLIGDGLLWRRAVDPDFDVHKILPVLVRMVSMLLNPVGADALAEGAAPSAEKSQTKTDTTKAGKTKTGKTKTGTKTEAAQ